MAINFSKTGEPVSPSRQHDWDRFLDDAGKCPRCGRSSFLFDRCPDCGSTMRHGRVKSVAGYVLLAFLAGLVIVLLQAGIFLLLGFLESKFRTSILALCVTMHISALALIAFLAIWNRTDMRYLSVSDILREETAPPGQRIPSLHWRFLSTVHDAYHLDLAWLEAASRDKAAEDRSFRDKLLGQAVWLSAICDCPRLALVRFRLLTRAQIAEGMDTDLNAIARQLSKLELPVLRALIFRPEAIRTLCDCLWFDPIGLREAYLPTYLSLLLSFLQDSGDRIDRQLAQRILQTLAYFGPEAYQGPLLEQLAEADILEALSVYNPDFCTVSQSCEGQEVCST